MPYLTSQPASPFDSPPRRRARAHSGWRAALIGAIALAQLVTLPSLSAHAQPPADVAPSVLSVVPANGATDVAANSDLVVTFSEPVNVSGSWFTIACAASGTRTAADVAVSGGPVSFTLNPNVDFAASEACTFTLIAAQVTDQDTNDPPETLAADFISGFTMAAQPPAACSLPSATIGSVQGTTDITPVAGQTVSVQGAVIADFEYPGSGSTSSFLRGFYVQDAGDGDPNSSDGIFVLNGNINSVSVGQVVRVTGVANESQGQTQLSSPVIEQCGTTATAAPVDVSLPVPSADYFERFEGMRVRLPQTLFVSEHFQLGRFGQVVMSSGDRLRIPTQLAAPGAPALAIQAQNDLNRIIVDDTVNLQNPDPIVIGGGTSPLAANNTLRIGDTSTGIVGVMTFGWAGNSASPNAYRVRPDAPPTYTSPFVGTNPRPARPEDVGGTLKVASTNVLNYFNTFTGCTLGVSGGSTGCRGAENQTEFDRQTVKIVAMLVGTGADVMSMSEIENDGYGPTSAIADLVNRLNAATAPGTYAYVDADTGTGQVDALGKDAIKVGLIYKPAKVMPVGAVAALNTGAFGEIITLPSGQTVFGTTQRNRPPLAVTFEQLLTGERITVVANHLKSKGSSCTDNFSPLPPDPDLGDGAGNCNLTRKIAAEEMAAWLASNPTGIATPNVLVTGDLNSYAKEDPITALINASYINLIEQRLGANAYSFVFGAQSGYLDHALASPALVARVTGVVEWHVNADEPNVLDYNLNFKSAGQQASLFAPDAFRSSDHDPLIVGINFNTPPAITALETYDTGLGELGAEIISIRGDRGVLSNAGDGSIDILDLSDPLDVKRIQRVKVPELIGLNSVAIHPTKDLFLAVAGKSSPAAAPVPGKVLAFRLSDGALIGVADVGIQPDSIAIAPDGNTAVVANEAESFARDDNGGPGSLSVLALAAFDPAAPTPLAVTQIALPSQNGIPGFSVNRTDDIARLPVDNTPGMLEPESVAFLADSAFAYISLQENSGAVRLNLGDNSLTFFGLGQAAHLADLIVDGVYRPVNPLNLFREPDGIAPFEIGGQRYFATADEGDTRDGAGNSGPRGGRTVSIFNADTGALIANTAGQLDDLAASRGVYPDTRSTRGGSEPEVLDAIAFEGKVIIAVGLERANGVALINATNPAAPRAFQFITAGVAPEGIKLVARDGALFAFAANEVSGTLTVARVPVGLHVFSQKYTEDVAVAMHDVAVIDPDAADTISVKIEVDRAYGALNTGTAGGTTSTFEPVVGVYRASGPLAEVNALLAGLVFTPFPDCFDTIPLTVTVNDGNGPDVIGVIKMVGIPVNDPPIARDDKFSVSRDTMLRIPTNRMTVNDTDPDGAGVGVASVSAPSARGGMVTLSNGVVTYTPPSGFTGTDRFAYVAADPDGGTATAMVFVNVRRPGQ